MIMLTSFLAFVADSVESNCTDFEVRLDPPSGGKVLICLNGVWGTVCSGGLQNQAASIVCEQSGYSRRGIVEV